MLYTSENKIRNDLCPLGSEKTPENRSKVSIHQFIIFMLSFARHSETSRTVCRSLFKVVIMFKICILMKSHYTAWKQAIHPKKWRKNLRFRLILLTCCETEDLPGLVRFSLGVDQLPVAMRGPQGLLCFLTRTTPGGSKKLPIYM